MEHREEDCELRISHFVTGNKGFQRFERVRQRRTIERLERLQQQTTDNGHNPGITVCPRVPV